MISNECVVQDDPRIRGIPLHEIHLAQFEHLEEHMVRTGDAGKQAVHVSAVREIFSKRRKLCSEGNEEFRARHAR
jgi:hypothetical protein